MRVVDIDPTDLVFYENNPRDNDEAVPIIANSIERFGFKVPVMIDSNKVIICGHTRVKAALNLGLETVPCIVEDEMSEEDIRAFRLVENKTHELSFWDSELLRKEMDALDIDGVLCHESDGFDYQNRVPQTVDTSDFGNSYIVLYTARLESDREVTLKWLEEHGVKYDCLIMNKLPYSLLIDDRATNHLKTVKE